MDRFEARRTINKFMQRQIDEEGIRQAKDQGRRAYQSGAGPYCPYGPEVDPSFYHAWHEGWTEQCDKA